MKLLRSPAFYAVSSVLAGAVFTCILLYVSQLWLTILSGVIAVVLVIIGIIAQAYQQYMEQNKYRFEALARMGQHTPGLIDYCRDKIKLWWKGRHPTCQDCKRSNSRSQSAWLYVPIGQWNEALQQMECGKMWLCFFCIERRLREIANQAHLASESSQTWKSKAEQLQGQLGNLESELAAKHNENTQ